MEIEVNSSFIRSASYNEDTQCLRILISRTYYYYYGVTKQKVARFKNATSKGKYFCTYIKGKYESKRRKQRC